MFPDPRERFLMAISGFATAEATRDRAQRHPAVAFAPLGRSGLTCSRAGFGGYRIGTSAPAHREALYRALRGGINLIDTSANYADGESEILVGQVLAECLREGSLSREAVIVVTKAGYLQGKNHALSRQRRKAGNPFPELVPYAEGLEHCIHPEFLEDQITRSLDRLALSGIDVLLLHNPEYYLSWAARQGVALSRARDIYADRLQRAFAHLEKEVDRGRIRFYGVSSNSFPAAADGPDFTSLSRVIACAQAVKPDHHLAVIQFPMNLFEPGAVLEANQPEGATLLDTALRFDLGTLVNRPLNAFDGSRLVRLADVPELEPLPQEAIRDRLHELAAGESHFFQEILPGLGLGEDLSARITEQLAMAEALAAHFDRYETYANWLQIQNEHIRPRADGVLDFLDRKADDPVLMNWCRDYRERLDTALSAVSGHYAAPAAARIAAVKAAVRQADADWDVDQPLSQMALRALQSTRGISSVLVGMRRTAYVEDVLAATASAGAAADRKPGWAKLKTRLDHRP